MRPFTSSDGNVAFGAKAWQMRPALAVHVALIANMWNVYEVNLALALTRLIGTDFQTAWLILFSAPNFNQRANLARKLVRHRLDRSSFAAFRVHLERAEKAAKDRNKIIHGVWGIADKHQQGIVRQDPQDVLLGSRMWLYEQPDFLAIEQAISALIAEIVEFDRSHLQQGPVDEPPSE